MPIMERIEQNNASGTQSNDGVFTITRQFLIRCDGGGKDAITEILADSELPQLGESGGTIGEVGKVICRDRGVEFNALGNDGDVWFLFSATYDNSPITLNAKMTGFDPAKEPWTLDPVINFGTTQFEKALLYDVTGKAVLNSAGDFFDPVPTRIETRLLITIKKNYETFEKSNIADWTNTINETEQTIDGVVFAIGQLKMNKINVATEYYGLDESEEPKKYYAVDYEIEGLINQKDDTESNPLSDSFLLKLLDCGYRIRNEADELIYYVGDDNNPPPSPVLLDGAGGKLGDDLNPATIPVYRDFEIYKKATWDLDLLPEA